MAGLSRGLQLFRGFFVFFFAGRQIDGVAAYHVRPFRRRIWREGYAGWRSLPVRYFAGRIWNLRWLRFDREFRFPHQPLHDRLTAIDLGNHSINLLAVIGYAAVGGIVAVPIEFGVSDVELRAN